MAPDIIHEKEAIQLLKDAVSIRSYSGEEKEVAEFLVREMGAMGFRAHIDEAGNAIGIIGPENDGPDNAARTILFAGHMDTVPGEIPIRIERDASGRDVLYGRGSVDAKGPLCAFIEGAGRAARRLGDDGDTRIIVAGCVEEECASSKGARHLIRMFSGHNHKPDMIIIGEPSGTSGITLGYKGRLVINYVLSVNEAHGASENKGAGEHALFFFAALQGFCAGFNMIEETTEEKKEKGIFEQLQMRLRSINTSSDGLYERVEMIISVRIPPNCDIDELKGFCEENKGGAELRFEGEELPIRAEKNNSLVRAFVKSIREAGLEPCFKLKTGTSDMNVLGNAFPGVPIIAYGPGDSSLDHTPMEHIELDEYSRAIRIIEGAMLFLGKEV